MAVPILSAQQLYKWVDDQGMTHYGDVLPNDEIEHESFQFEEYTQVDKPNDDYYSINNQLQRLQERRAETLKRRQQAAEIASAKYPQAQENLVHDVDDDRHYSGRRYLGPVHYPHGFNRYGQHVTGGFLHDKGTAKSRARSKHSPRTLPASSSAGLVSHSNSRSSKAFTSKSKKAAVSNSR